MITSVYQLARSIQRYTQIMADSWQIAIICYLCGMKQIEATPILDIVSRIVSIKADLDDTAFLDSIHHIVGEFMDCSSITDSIDGSDRWGTLGCYIDNSHIEFLHSQLQKELTHLANVFASSDISTKEVLEHLRSITTHFCRQIYDPYFSTEEEAEETIEQYTIQLEITTKLIEAFKIRKKFLHKTACAKEAKEKSKKMDSVHFGTIRLDIDSLKRLYKNLCSEMVISNTSEETFLYVFGGHTLPKNKTIRWEGSLSLLVALFDTVVKDYEVWKIASCCFEKKGKDGCYSMVDRNQLKTTKQRNQSSHKYTEYLKMIENFC